MKTYGKFLKITAIVCIFAIILASFSGCKEKTTVIEYGAFGSSNSALFLTDDINSVAGFFTAMESSIKKSEAEFSVTEENSQLRVLNETGLNYVSDTLKKALEDSVIVCTALGDIVDISMGKPLKLWGFYTDSPALPDSKELKAAVDAHTMDKLVIARDSNKVTITDDMEIDMSPAAKGIALDRAFLAGRDCKIPYLLTLGDMTLAYGEGPLDGEWEIPLKDPFSENEEGFATIRISGKGIQNNIFASASGVWENSFTENGKAYHSCLDPETGYPCDNGLVSVTVVTESGITADALSDALFINGFTEKSLDYIESFFADAVFVFADKTYYVTEGLKDSFTLKDSSFTEHTEAPATELF